MKFTVTYTVNDFLDAQKAYLKKTTAGRIFSILFPLLGILFLISLFFHFTPSAVGFGTFFLLFPFALRFQMKRSFLKTKALQLPTEIEFTGEWLKSSNELASSQVGWNFFVRYYYTDKVVLLFHNNRVFNFIPRRALPNDAAWQELLGHVKERIK